MASKLVVDALPTRHHCRLFEYDGHGQMDNFTGCVNQSRLYYLTYGAFFLFFTFHFVLG